MSTKSYPTLKNATLGAAIGWIADVTKTRQDDIGDYDNMPSRFVMGRTVGKIPSSSTDIATTDRKGDVSYAADGSYMYLAVMSGANLVWRRIALGVW